MGFNVLGYGLKTLANPSTSVTLQGGQYAVLPAGQWMVMPGKYTFLQFYCPQLRTWRNLNASYAQQPFMVSSDGYNYRLFNPTGCVVGAVVTNGGTANTSKNGVWVAGSDSTAGVTVTTTGGATFNAIVGGEINTTVTVTAGGSGYVLPPIITFSNPAPGGWPATGYATLTGGAVSSVTVTNQGAGYTSAPTVTVTPVAGDPGTGCVLTAAVASTNSGKLVGVTMANFGSAYTSVPTLTVAGLAGSPAATAIMCFAVATATTVTGGTHYANGAQVIYNAGTTSGSNTTTNPAYTTGLYQVRNGFQTRTTSADGTGGTIVDAGLSQVDHSNLCTIAFASDGTIPGATTFASGAVGGVVDQSFAIPL